MTNVLNLFPQSLWQHVIPEETDDLPAFEKYLSEERSLEIAKQFRRSQYFTPTRKPTLCELL